VGIPRGASNFYYVLYHAGWDYDRIEAKGGIAGFGFNSIGHSFLFVLEKEGIKVGDNAESTEP